jgi:hypothetical protein
MPLTFLTATIPAGQSVSNGINVESQYLVRMRMPDDWTQGAEITFELSPDNVIPYAPMYTGRGRVQVPVVPGAVVMLEYGWSTIEYMRIRSGTMHAPHIQQADRVFTIARDTKAAA